MERVVSALTEFFVASSHASDVESSLAALARAIPQIVAEIDRASVVLPVDDHLEVVALDGNRAIPKSVRIPIETSVVGQAFRSASPWPTASIPPGTSWTDLQALYAAGIRSCVALPLVIGDEVMGLLNLGSVQSPRDWSEPIDRLRDVTRIVAAQLHFHRRWDETRHALEDTRDLSARLTKVTECGFELMMARTEEAVFDTARRSAEALVSCDRMSVTVVTPGVDEARVFLLTGADKGIPDRLPTTGTHLLAQVMDAKTLLAHEDLTKLDHREARMLARAGLRSAITAPLLAGDQCLGSLNLGWRRKGAWTANDMRVVRQLASTLATALLAVRARQSLIAARVEAESLAQTRRRFLGVMAHELRTPLGAVTGMCELLIRAEMPPELEPKLRVIHRGAETMRILIDDTLDFSKGENGGDELRVEWIDAAELVAQVVELARVRDPGPHVELRTEISLARPLIAGDRARLTQVLINLVSNALKFTERGHVAVIVDEGEDGDTLRFAVEDTGIGIPAEAIERIFDPFQQVAGTRGGQPGVGLGLAICRQAAATMGGELRVRSAAGEGSTFELVVPKSGDAPLPTDKTQVVATDPLDMLVVDDNLLNLTVISAQLSVLRHRVTTASSCDEAFARASERSFDAILMDVYLDGCDGLEVTRRILRESRVRPEIFGYTADTDESTRERCIAAGMTAVLHKPVALGELERTLAGVGRRAAPST